MAQEHLKQIDSEYRCIPDMHRYFYEEKVEIIALVVFTCGCDIICLLV